MEKKRLVDFLNIDPPPKDPMVSNYIPNAKQIESHVSLLKREHEEEEHDDDDDDYDHDGIGVTSGRRYSRFTACFRGLGARKQNLGIARRTMSMRNEEKSSGGGGGGGDSARRVKKAFSMRELSMASVREKYRKVDHRWDYDPEDEISLFAVENGKMETSTQGFMKAPETDKKKKAKIFKSCKRFFGF